MGSQQQSYRRLAMSYRRSEAHRFLIWILVASRFVLSDALLCQNRHWSRAFRPNDVNDKGRRWSRTSLSMVAKSGGKIITTTEDFSECVLSSDLVDRPVMVFYSAPWCGPCRLSVPVVREIMKQFSGQIDVVEVCTDDLPDVAADSGVVSIPTIQMYYGGDCLDTIVGCVARNVLASAVDKVLEDVTGTSPNNNNNGNSLP